jgi:PAS domain S-box-containing protein
MVGANQRHLSAGDDDTVVWGTGDDSDTVVSGTTATKPDTVVWGTSCDDSSCDVNWGGPMSAAPRKGLRLPHAAARRAVCVAAVIAGGAYLMIAFFPTTFPRPVLFAMLLVCACVTSTWKVSLPLSVGSGSTLSVSYAAFLMALLLVGPSQAMVVAVVGAWTQCTFRVKQPYPLYRTVFSMAGEAITIQATSLAFIWLGGADSARSFAALPQPLVGSIATYFLVNTGLVAAAIALSTRQPLWQVWHDDFFWSAPSFMVAGSGGAIAAVVVERGASWLAILMVAPIYLSYRTYRVFLGRIEDEQRHNEETRQLHEETVRRCCGDAPNRRWPTRRAPRVALRSIGDGVITTGLDGTIMLINNVAEALTGWSQEEAVGKPLAQVWQTLDPETKERRDSSVPVLLSNGETLGAGRCTILVARDLSERPIEQSVVPLCDAKGDTIGTVVAFRDITDALKVHEERAKAGRLASLGLLAGGIAHDFNNIIMAIMGNVSLARVTMATGSAVGALADAEQACVRARQLTWQLLTFSKGGAPVKKTLALPRILKESSRLALCASNAGFTLDIAPDLWVTDADEGQLVQVFHNVLINAQQAMPQGGAIRIVAQNVLERGERCEYALRVEEGRYVRISIADKGIGIPDEHLSKIFDPYFSTKQGAAGWGWPRSTRSSRTTAVMSPSIRSSGGDNGACESAGIIRRRRGGAGWCRGLNPRRPAGTHPRHG